VSFFRNIRENEELISPAYRDKKNNQEKITFAQNKETNFINSR